VYLTPEADELRDAGTRRGKGGHVGEGGRMIERVVRGLLVQS
jgi:hypothetical protein